VRENPLLPDLQDIVWENEPQSEKDRPLRPPHLLFSRTSSARVLKNMEEEEERLEVHVKGGKWWKSCVKK
jgi:hypothetical protein